MLYSANVVKSDFSKTCEIRDMKKSQKVRIKIKYDKNFIQFFNYLHRIIRNAVGIGTSFLWGYIHFRLSPSRPGCKPSL